MSATKTVGNYEVAKRADRNGSIDEDLFYVKMGVKNKRGELILQAIWVGITEDQAMNRAEAYCELMTNQKPPES